MKHQLWIGLGENKHILLVRKWGRDRFCCYNKSNLDNSIMSLSTNRHRSCDDQGWAKHVTWATDKELKIRTINTVKNIDFMKVKDTWGFKYIHKSRGKLVLVIRKRDGDNQWEEETVHESKQKHMWQHKQTNMTKCRFCMQRLAQRGNSWQIPPRGPTG